MMHPAPISEWQFDGLVGPTHNYAGLAHGNMASASNAGAVSNPRAAALQGLKKMRFVHDLGVKQAILPPHKRPLIGALQNLGFGHGSSRDAIVHSIDLAYRTAPDLLAAVFSSSFMWAANAATVTPSLDAADGKLHLTPANLISHFHRALEAPANHRLLSLLFPNRNTVTIHPPLPATHRFSDEGAANHMRLTSVDGSQRVHVFVYGATETTNAPKRYLARQQREASETIARAHALNAGEVCYWQQHPDAIDAGVFHNDVIAMSGQGVLIAHEMAFVDQKHRLEEIRNKLNGQINCIEIPNKILGIKEVVSSYLFNSQLLHVDNKTILVAPVECEALTGANQPIAWLMEECHAIHEVHYLDVRESMRNGGGPACLRLRVPMTDAEAATLHQGIILTESRAQALESWIIRHYRDALTLDDFRDPQFLDELQLAYAALQPIIEMPGLYSNYP